jgi:holo-[acyl-carrier protein] synthase
MIIGTGIDMIEVERVAEKIGKGNGFREKIFSASEIAFCESKTNKAEHYAARFAAKEAFLKATGKGLTETFDLNLIELNNDDLGKPTISLHGVLETRARELNWKKIHVSLSHLKSIASAVVIIEG